MEISTFEQLTGDDFQKTFSQRCMDLNNLIQTHRKKQQSSHQDILKKVFPLVARRVDVAQWDPDLSRGFLRMGIIFATEDAVSKMKTSPEGDTEFLDRKSVV